MVYTRKVGDREIHLAVSGMLWNRSLVMFDPETESLWSHLLGRGMRGPMKGQQLQAIPADMMTWKAWKRLHPETSVLNLSRTSRNYRREFYRRPERFVLGWIDDQGQAWSANFDVLLKHPIHNLKGDPPLLLTFDRDSTAARLFSRNLQDEVLVFERDPQAAVLRDSGTQSVWDPASGVAIEGPLRGKRLRHHVGIMSYARAWQQFHPDSRSLRVPESGPE